jgi:opacity protein-like surface antigen
MKRTCSKMLVTMAAFGLLGAVPDLAWAQMPRLEVFAGYSHLFNQRATNKDVANVQGLTPTQVKGLLGVDVTTSTGRAGMSGIHTSVTRFFNERIGLTGELSGNFKTEDATFFGLPGSSKVKAFQFLGGPHIRFANRSRLTPFVRALAGVARLDATYVNPVARFVDDNTALALTFGGGVDVQASDRLAVRIIQVDYNSIALGERRVVDSSGVPFEMNDIRRQNIRLAFGVVWR